MAIHGLQMGVILTTYPSPGMIFQGLVVVVHALIFFRKDCLKGPYISVLKLREKLRSSVTCLAGQNPESNGFVASHGLFDYISSM